MSAAQPSLQPRDPGPDTERFRAEVLGGLRQPQKRIPCKYFYDARGSALFEQICELDEYYPTRTELEITASHAGEMAECLGSRCLLIEYGSGSSLKTRLLLDRLKAPMGYVPIDISPDALAQSALALERAYPDLAVLPICADYTAPFELPDEVREVSRREVYFPGSTIGNFTPREARGFLETIAGLVEPAGGLLIGVDLKKDAAVLEAAYDDRQGVTAAFNLNLLERINRELGANFEIDDFRHRAFYNAAEGRIEMHLVSEHEQTVKIDGVEIEFETGESIHTENCYKYAIEEFHALAEAAGLDAERIWTDAAELFSVHYLTAA
jgi:dimethylhistidine N-methyltransferase